MLINAYQFVSAHYAPHLFGVYKLRHSTKKAYYIKSLSANQKLLEVGYLVLKKYWGKGYASRILKILLAWAKNNIKKDKIIAFIPLDHIASERVMQKAGMTFSKKGIMKGVECVIYEYKL